MCCRIEVLRTFPKLVRKEEGLGACYGALSELHNPLHSPRQTILSLNPPLHRLAFMGSPLLRVFRPVQILLFEYAGCPSVMSSPAQHTPFQSTIEVSSATQTETASSGQPKNSHNEPPGPFRLFALPGELRNIVYAHVLETDEAILMAPYLKDGALHQRLILDDPTTKLRVDLNQMKFVCKKLYEETSALPPTRCPELIFPLRKDTSESASSICASYIAGSRPEQLNGIRRIHVHERIAYRQGPFSTHLFDPCMSQLVTFATHYPSTSIQTFLHAVDPKVSNDTSKFPIAGFSYEIARKRVDTTSGYYSAWYNIDRVLDEMAETWSDHAFEPQPFPGNFVFRLGCGVRWSDWQQWVGLEFPRPLLTRTGPNYTGRYDIWFLGRT